MAHRRSGRGARGAAQSGEGHLKPSSLAGQIRIGISGWRYAPWRGKFYPEGLKQKDELAYAARRFRAIEINGTFYSLQPSGNYRNWVEQTPDDFIFALKGPRYITHMLRLRGVETALANFLASGMLLLGPKLGPLVWQLPPNFQFDAERLEAFFRLLPRDTEAASKMARRHDRKLKERAVVAIDRKRPLRHALEIRHDSFVTPDFIRLLRKYRVALCCADTVEWPRLMDVTADFIYCRLHGSEQLYASGYDDRDLNTWASRIAAWSRGGQPEDGEYAAPGDPPKRSRRDVFVFFDNDMKVRAPVDALSLSTKVARQLGMAR
jgi:uncharacterized protein YecE (DUF72 family)